MFQPRQLFRRSSGAGKRVSATPLKVEGPARYGDRHPAMRGLQVSPVHGRHCICGRCEQHHEAA